MKNNTQIPDVDRERYQTNTINPARENSKEAKQVTDRGETNEEHKPKLLALAGRIEGKWREREREQRPLSFVEFDTIEWPTEVLVPWGERLPEWN